MPDTDGQLYIRFLNENDEEAFNCIFDRYNEGLMLFLYEIVGDREDAKGSPSDYRGALYCMCKNAINSIFLHYN